MTVNQSTNIRNYCRISVKVQIEVIQGEPLILPDNHINNLLLEIEEDPKNLQSFNLENIKLLKLSLIVLQNLANHNSKLGISFL